MSLKFHITAFFDVIGTKRGGITCYAKEDVCFNLVSTLMERHIFGYFVTKTKSIFVEIIYRHLNNVNFLECFEKHLDNINFDNEIFLLGDFNINLPRNGKYIRKERKSSYVEYLVQILSANIS